MKELSKKFFYIKSKEKTSDQSIAQVWALHGAVGMSQDWKQLNNDLRIPCHAVNLWRFLQ